MTVMVDRFFGIPQSAVRLGKLTNLSGLATKLYVALWHESERCQTRELTRTTAELRALVGGARNSHAKARAELVRTGLVESEPFGIAGFVFHLCNPETGKPWLFDPKTAIPYQKKSAASVSNAQKCAVPSNPTKPPKIAGAGTSFSFGHNPLEQPSQAQTSPVPSRVGSQLGWGDIGH